MGDLASYRHEARDRISGNAHQLVETHYDWSVISRKLMTICSGVVSQS